MGSGLDSYWQGWLPVTHSVSASLASSSFLSAALIGRANGLLAFNNWSLNIGWGWGDDQGTCASGANAGCVLHLKFSSLSAHILFYLMVTALPGMYDALITS